jgi:hypothetical protein
MRFILDIHTLKTGWVQAPIEAEKITIVGNATISISEATGPLAMSVGNAAVFTSKHPEAFPGALRIGIVTDVLPVIEREKDRVLVRTRTGYKI